MAKGATQKEKSNSKRSVNVPVWLTEEEVQELDREREALIAKVPGARLDRSPFLAQIFREHLAQGAGR